MEIRPLGEDDAQTYWKLRMEALQTEPFAFGRAPEEHQAAGVAEIVRRFREPHERSFTLGAFEGGELIGTATFVRDTSVKGRHKGNIYGVYVTASQRGRGIGGALIGALLKKAASDPSLEQFVLAAAVQQKAAGQLYRKFGFECFGTQPRALKVGSEYVDEEHMLLQLAKP